MKIVRWWASAWTVGVLAGTVWSALLVPPSLNVFVPGLALVYALQVPVLVIPTGLVVLASEYLLHRLVAPSSGLKLAPSVALSVLVSVAVVVWAEPQAGLIAIAVVAAGTATIMSHSEAGTLLLRWAVLPMGCVIALVAGLLANHWWGLS